MSLRFRPVTAVEYAEYREGAAADYARQMVELGGVEPEAARAKADADLAALLPPGRPLETHRFTVAEEHGEWVGIVWIGPAREGFEGSWVYDVTVAERHRGRGFGRSLMVEAERLAREAGQARLGLNVFGGNAVAIRLYSELGYHVDAQQMSKALDGP